MYLFDNLFFGSNRREDPVLGQYILYLYTVCPTAGNIMEHNLNSVNKMLGDSTKTGDKIIINDFLFIIYPQKKISFMDINLALNQKCSSIYLKIDFY